jgi:hypothetical protein
LRIQIYPADIVTTEEIEKTGTTEEIFKDIEKNLLKKIKEITKMSGYYISDMKIGELKNYRIDKEFLGYGLNGKYIISDDKKKYMIIYAKLLNKLGFFKIEDYKKIKNMFATDKILNSDDYLNILNIWRSYRVIRWTPEEVMRKYKIFNGEKIKLFDALQSGGHFKIDLIVKINNKFTELTNFIVLLRHNEDGTYNLLNLEKVRVADLQKFFNDKMKNDLPKEIERLFYSNYYYSPFKGVKRVWALSRVLKNNNMLNLLSDMISGDVSLLYQLKSELQNILLIFGLKSSPPIKGINDQIDDIKQRLWNVTYIPNDYVTLLSEEFEKTINEKDLDNKYKMIENLKNSLSHLVNILTIKELEKKGIYNFKYPYIPKESTFNTSRFIKPEENLIYKSKGGSVELYY